MNFKEQYQKEISGISPTEEQCERIRGNVLRRISGAPQKKKKPLPLKVIAVSGASAAACAVIALTAVTLHGLNFGKIYPQTNNAMYEQAPSADFIENAGGTDNADTAAADGDNYGNADYDAPQAVPSDKIGSNPEGGAKNEGVFVDTAEPSENAPDDTLQNFDASYDFEGYEADIITLRFSDDGERCIVYRNGSTSEYYRIDGEEGDFSEAALPAADTDGEKLSVYFEGDKMWAFDKDSEFLGVFVSENRGSAD